MLSLTFLHILGPSKGYLSTQFLMETSLSQDVNCFDFNDPIEAYTFHSTANADSLPPPSPNDQMMAVDDSNTPTTPTTDVRISISA